MSKDYCVILAGGTGRRLWPASGKALPKQFVDIFGIGSTLLQLTYERFARFIEPDHIYVSTFVDYIDIVERQLPDLPRRHILAEPVRLGTAPAVAWANSHIIYKEPDARVVVSPAATFSKATFATRSISWQTTTCLWPWECAPRCRPPNTVISKWHTSPTSTDWRR